MAPDRGQSANQHAAPPSVIACDLGGTKLSAAIVTPNLDRQFVVRQDIRNLNYAEVIATVVDTIERMANDHPGVCAVGVAVAGQVDAKSGTISHRAIKVGEREIDMASLPVQEFALADMIRARTRGLKVVIENDGNAAALAEWRAGAARGTQYVVCLVVGTYLGSGIINGGHIVRRRTSGPLLGGTLWPDLNDPTILRYIGELASGHEVEVLARQASGDVPQSAKILAARARAGDTVASSAFARVGSALQVAIVDAANVWDPQVIVLAGGLMGAADLLLDGLPAFMRRWRLPGADETEPSVRLAHFGEHASIMGAAIAAFDDLGVAIIPV